MLNPVAGLHEQLAELGSYTIRNYVDSLGFRPLWFVELLIIFTAGYLVLRRGRPAPEPREETLRVRQLVGFTAVLVLVTYLFRIAVPLASADPILQMASPYQVPQYIALFVIGVLAYRRGWCATCRPGSGSPAVSPRPL